MNSYRGEKASRSAAGFTVLEMLTAVVVLGVLSAMYYVMVESYQERRMSEQAAKVLMLAARAQEEYFAKEHRYFDAEVSANGGDANLITPEGSKTKVTVPARVVLSLKTKGKERTAFVGHAFFSGSKVAHRYDSDTGKIVSVQRTQDDAGWQ
jgi:prepilin-type N-terminal cleavage/methylation domain-containing protein